MKYRTLEGYKYELLETETFDVFNLKPRRFIQTDYITISGGVLYILDHYAWDGPSGPTIDTKNFMLASLAHDALYQLMREGYLPVSYRKYADKLLRKLCLANGMSKFRAWYVYHSVRMFAGGSARPQKKTRGKVVTLNNV